MGKNIYKTIAFSLLISAMITEITQAYKQFPSEFCKTSENNFQNNDSLALNVRRIYNQANKEYLKEKTSAALELYAQFIFIAENQNLEKSLWQEIRTSRSYMSAISTKLLNQEKSIEYLKEALEITLKYNPSDYENSFSYLFNIAKKYYSINDFINSLGYYQQAESLYHTSGILPISDKALLYNNISLCYLKLGNYVESQSYILQAITIKTALGNHDELANNYNNAGLVYQSMAKYEDALYYFQRSLLLYDSINNQERASFVINNIGNLYLDQEAYDKSIYFYHKASMMREQNLMTSSNYTDLVKSYNNLSFIYAKLNNLDSALQYNNRAIKYNIPDPDLGISKEYYSVPDYLVSVADLIEINSLKFKSLNRKEYLLQSYDLFQGAIKVLIDQLIKYNSTFSSNIFVNENKRLFDLSMYSCFLLDSISPNVCPRTLIISEIYKSLSMLNLGSEIRSLNEDSVTRTHCGQINSYYQLEQFLFDKESNPGRISRIAIIDSLVNKTLEIDSQNKNFSEIFKKNLLNYITNISDSILFRVGNLEETRLVFDYYLAKNALYVNKITKKNVGCTMSKVSNEFLEALERFPISIKSYDQSASSLMSTILSNVLLDPENKELKLFENITIIPDQLLSDIPFEALNFQASNSTPKHYLVASNTVSYRFSFLNRNYSGLNADHEHSVEFFGVAPFELADTSGHSLKGCVREITEIANLYQKRKQRVEYLIGKDATSANLLNSPLDARIVHFSTHSYIDQNSANLSFIELFPFKDRSLLFLPALSSIPFHNDLLILNACETGKNLLSTSTGFVSFIRSLSSVYIHNSICALWKIYDEPSSDFMINFYFNLMNGYNYTQSLTLAKRLFLHSPKYNNPLFWSTFVLYENN
jgi:CHAT domain-containing protein